MAKDNVAPIDWDNFDKVTAIIEDFTEKSQDRSALRDANDALGQLLGVTDNPVFRNMNADQQNIFLQNVIGDYNKYGLSPVDVAQKLLEGCGLRPPSATPRTPTPAFAPSLGPSLATPTPGGNATTSGNRWVRKEEDAE